MNAFVYPILFIYVYVDFFAITIYLMLIVLLSAIIKIALHGMDREMREEYLVVIQAKDMGGHMGGLSGTTTVTVTLTDVNDNPPKFSKSKQNVKFSLHTL